MISFKKILAQPLGQPTRIQGENVSVLRIVSAVLRGKVRKSYERQGSRNVGVGFMAWPDPAAVVSTK